MEKCQICSSSNVEKKFIKTNNWIICKKCSHSSLFLDKNASFSANYYDQNLATLKLKSRHRYLARILKKFNNKNILDIGAGNYLAALLIKNYFKPLIYTGIDMNYNKNANQITNLNQINGDTFKALDGLKNKYDFIILDNILEHLENPRIILDKIKMISRKNTIIYVSVPNKYNLKNFRDFNREYHHPSEHIQVFTNKSIHKLFYVCGFKQLNFFRRFEFLSSHLHILISLLGFPIFGIYKVFIIKNI